MKNPDTHHEQHFEGWDIRTLTKRKKLLPGIATLRSLRSLGPVPVVALARFKDDDEDEDEDDESKKSNQ